MAKKVVHKSGKRKRAVARATFSSGKGKVTINSKPVDLYEPDLARLKIREPLELAGKRAPLGLRPIADGQEFRARATIGSGGRADLVMF